MDGAPQLELRPDLVVWKKMNTLRSHRKQEVLAKLKKPIACVSVESRFALTGATMFLMWTIVLNGQDRHLPSMESVAAICSASLVLLHGSGGKLLAML